MIIIDKSAPPNISSKNAETVELRINGTNVPKTNQDVKAIMRDVL